MTYGNNSISDRSKIGIKMNMLTDKKGIPLSVVITPTASILMIYKQ
jgi:hypothetical protein